MASGTINLSSSNTAGTLQSYIVGKITWSSSNDEKANTSDVTAKLYVRKLHPSMTLTVPTSGTWDYKLTINNTVVPGSKSLSVLEDWVLVTSYTVKDIEHASSGKKSITISGSVSAPSGTSLAGHTTSGSASVDLGTISRAATVESLSCSTAYLDGTITAKYTPKNSSYYNRRVVYLNKGGSLTTIRDVQLGQKAAASTESTINLSDEELSKIYAKITATTAATIRVSFMTYSDSFYSKKVGDTQYKEITLTIPTAIKPTASLSATAVNANSWIKSLGVYVAGYSQVKLALTASPGEGASLASTTISGDDFSVAESSVTANIAASGNFTFTGKATDSRGRSASSSKAISVLPYSPPAVASITVERGEYTSAWEARENGPDIRVVFKVGLSLVDQGNTYSAAFTMDGAARVPNGGATSGLASGANRAVYFLDLDGEVSHTLTFTFTDKVGTESKAAVIVPTDNVTIEYRENGKGIAFGKTSERDGLECAWPAYFGEAIYVADKITGTKPYNARAFNINCNWADNGGHDILVRQDDGLTVGLGWSGSGDDGNSYETALDVRTKAANFRGAITAPRGRFTATTDLSGTEQNEPALRIGDPTGQHIDVDSNEIQAKQSPTETGPLYLNLDGGDVFAGDFRIPEIQRGSVTITPSAANTPTSVDVTFSKAFSGTPTVITTMATSVPGTTVLGTGVNSVSATGCKIWVTRTNTTNTVVNWIAVY